MNAQTNIQLYEQLRAGGYPSADLGIVHAAYGLASHLYAGRFQSSGKVFLAHLVGVASALAALRQPAAAVAAGLLHNAYRTGDFGREPDGVSDAKRRSIASAVGEEVEARA